MVHVISFYTFTFKNESNLFPAYVVRYKRLNVDQRDKNNAKLNFNFHFIWFYFYRQNGFIRSAPLKLTSMY